MSEQKKNTSIVKREPTSISRVSKSIEITNKLLAFGEEPFLIPYRKGDKWGFCDRNKKIIIPCIYEDAVRYSEGLAAVKFNNKWGFIDNTGKEVIPAIYYTAGSFKEGLAKVSLISGLGFIDTIGKIIIPIKNDSVIYSEGFIALEFDYHFSGWKFKDRTGKSLITDNMYRYYDPVEHFKNGGYASVMGFSEGLAAVLVNLDGKWKYMDITGKEIISTSYNDVDSFSEGLAAVRLINNWGFIDKKGSEIIPCKYQGAGSYSQGLACVNDNGKCGFIDKTGNEIIPCIYDDIPNIWGYRHYYTFSEGIAAVRRNNKWGFIDMTGKETVSCIFQDARSFSEGLAAVKYNDRWGFIDKTGKEVISCIYDYPDHFTGRLFFLEDLADVRYNDFDSNDKRGFIDKSGNEFWED